MSDQTPKHDGNGCPEKSLKKVRFLSQDNSNGFPGDTNTVSKKALSYPLSPLGPTANLLAHRLQESDKLETREPSLRSELKWSGQKFAKEFNKNLSNLEAAAIYVVGVKLENACGHCQRGYGPFEHCVFAEGCTDACANCHWKGNGFICDFSKRRISAKEYRRRSWIAATIARTELVSAIDEMRAEYEAPQKLTREKLLELQDQIMGKRGQDQMSPLARMNILGAFEDVMEVHEEAEKKGKEVIDRMTNFHHGAGRSVAVRMLQAFRL